MESFFIADGHHRSASAANVGVKRRELAKAQGYKVTGHEGYNYFMALAYPKS